MIKRPAIMTLTLVTAVALLMASLLSACAGLYEAPPVAQAGQPVAAVGDSASTPTSQAPASGGATTPSNNGGSGPASQQAVAPSQGSPAASTDGSWDPDYTALKKQIQDFFAATDGTWSVYVKDLDSGKTFGVNQDLAVPAASTVKVPVVLYATTLAAQGKLSMDERLTYLSSRDYRTGSGSLQYTARDGDQFTIAQLCEKAITESDNVAWKMLERRLGVGNIAAFMTSIGGKYVYPDGQNISTARDMATYMEAALDRVGTLPGADTLMYNLAHTIWNTGLNRFIANQVTVAHKEGDVSGVSDDVGVVYAKHPYIVAVMSKNQSDVEAGFEKIGELSKMIYNYQEALSE